MGKVQAMFADQRSELPEEWHDAFDQLVGQGNSPSGVLAAIEYIRTDRTQKEVANEYNVTKVTIRNLQEAALALGPQDAIRSRGNANQSRSAIDFCTHIADWLDWEEGVEYSVTDPTYGDTGQPRLLKPGWKSLYQHIAEGDDE